MLNLEQDFVYFEKWALKHLSVNLSAYKSKQLHRRINQIMSRSGVSDLRKYTELLQKDVKLKNDFLDYITINVSEFFRNKNIFDDLEKNLKNILVPNYPKLRIWSAACSFGPEPYSIAIILEKMNKNHNHYILATDIDTNILQRARDGIYQKSEMKNIDLKDLTAYFDEENGKYHLKDTIKRRVTFKKHDLILDSYEKNFHLIVCRNVVIYFNDEIKNQIYQKFYDNLVPGGLLFVGATETIYNYRKLGFEKVSTFIYQKKP